MIRLRLLRLGLELDLVLDYQIRCLGRSNRPSPGRSVAVVNSYQYLKFLSCSPRGSVAAGAGRRAARRRARAGAATGTPAGLFAAFVSVKNCHGREVEEHARVPNREARRSRFVFVAPMTTLLEPHAPPASTRRDVCIRSRLWVKCTENHTKYQFAFYSAALPLLLPLAASTCPLDPPTYTHSKC